MRKYFRILRYAARDQVAYLPAFLARNLFFVIILFIFSSLWKVIYAGQSLIAGFSVVQALWYLTFTETVELSKSRLLTRIQGEVKDGSLAVTMTRPYSYPLSHFFHAMGESMVRLLPILAVGFLFATLFVGPLPGYFKALPFGLILLLCGMALDTLWLLCIGLLAFWSEEVSPYYWIIQKLIFILGGLFIPIDMFPDWLSGIARTLPFAFSAYWPAYTMVSFSWRAFFTGLAGAACYIGALSAVAALLFGLGKRRVHAQGG